jgi:hypothetical protein
MRAISIGFSRNKSYLAIGSLLIQLWQRARFSHTYVKFTTPYGVLVFQASKGIVNIMREDTFLLQNVIVQEIVTPVSAATFSRIKSLLFEFAGRPYAFLQTFLGIPFVGVCKFLGIKVKNPWSNGLNCSELVANILIEAQIAQNLDFDLNTVTPLDVYRFLSKKHDIVQ